MPDPMRNMYPERQVKPIDPEEFREKFLKMGGTWTKNLDLFFHAIAEEVNQKNKEYEEWVEWRISISRI